MKKVEIMPINFEYFDAMLKKEGITQTDLSKLLGHSAPYLSYHKSANNGFPVEAVNKIAELIDVDMKQLLAKTDDVDEEPTTDDKVINVLIQRIGQLEQRMEQFEERLEKPAIVTIPMNAKDMAILTMGELLEGGWTTKDDVLRSFNEKHIPIEYISVALKANNAISATSGVADRARTFYIGQGALNKTEPK